MNRKTIIQLVVIVVAFGASGFVIYNGMFKKPKAPPPIQIPLATMPGGVGVSPSGNSPASAPSAQISIQPGNFEKSLEVLHRNGLQYGFQYPDLNEEEEVGVDLRQLINPLAPSAASNP